MSNTKFNKLNRAELIDMLCMNQNLLKKKEEEINVVKQDLIESNRQNSQLQESIDDLTTQKFEALEQVKEFRSKLINSKKYNNITIVILIITLIALIVAIIL